MEIWLDETTIERENPGFDTPKKLLKYWLWKILEDCGKILKVEEKSWKDDGEEPKLCRYQRIKHTLEFEKYLLEHAARKRK